LALSLSARADFAVIESSVATILSAFRGRSPATRRRSSKVARSSAFESPVGRNIKHAGALLAGTLTVLFAGHLRRLHRLEQGSLIKDLLRSCFKGEVPTDQLGRRRREIVGHGFTHGDEFYSLVVSAFQSAVDASRTRQTQAKQGDRELLSAMAALKNEFGLTDLYQVEAWRPWRE